MKISKLMKKIFTSLFLISAALTATAQQLPDVGFESDWVDCVPWTSNNNTTAYGKSPAGGWKSSNNPGSGGTGSSPELVTKVAGYNSASCAYLKNNHIQMNIVIVKVDKVVPAYLTLGEPWATSKGTNATNKDGGTFGGKAFVYRPDALSFYYKSEGETDRPEVVAYTWKGSTSQADVPGNIVVTGNPKTVATMTNRDRNILDITTDQGQAITKSADFALISKLDERLDAAQSNWTYSELALTYSSTASPEMINVIFSAGEYFSSEPKADNNMYVDDVKLLYYSRLKSLTVNGVAVSGFDSKNYNYDLSSVDMPTDASAIAYELLSNSGSSSATVTLDPANFQVKITVSNSNVGGLDYDNQATHTYTLNFKKVYFSRLSDLRINGTTVNGFSPDQFSYTVDTELPEESAFSWTLMGTDNASTVSVTRDTENATATVTVTNPNGADTDGQSTHSYVLQFKKASTGGEGGGEGGGGTGGGTTGDDNRPQGDTYLGVINVDIPALEANQDLANQEVHIISTGTDVCTVALYDFYLAEDKTDENARIGDIIVPNVTITREGSKATYSGKVTGMQLSMAGMDIVADVDVTGTVEGNKAKMVINVIWIADPSDPEQNVPITVTFNGDFQKSADEKPAGDTYSGIINVNIPDMEADQDLANQEVHIISTGTNVCTVALYDFYLSEDKTDETAKIGDIVVPNVTITREGAKSTYTGEVKGMQLTMAGMDIVADVNVTGTVEGNKATMTINVIWIANPDDPEQNVPIYVTFNGELTASGITDVWVDDTDAPVEYYNIQGMRVNGENLTPGFYIVKQGRKVTKILVR